MLSSLLLIWACGGRGDGQPGTAGVPAPPASSAIFRDVAAAAGLDFVHFNGMSGESYMVEVISPGGGLIDFDGDGDLDLYLVQGAMLGPGRTLAQATFPPRQPPPLTDRLFRNDTAGPGEPLRFVDVTARAGLTAEDYGVGVAAADYDGDGAVDLYLTNLGPNRLLRNRGDGSFEDATARAGVGDPSWSVPASFFDYDRDGRLDLFVGNYVAFDFAELPVCHDLTGAVDYCGPGVFPAEPDRLYRNLGGGRFEDVTSRLGIDRAFGPALGALAADFDGDGWTDVYVANDAQPNQLWINRVGTGFVDESLLAGVALNRDGQAEGSMGVDVGDFDGDGDFDLIVTHLRKETNTVYRNDGQGQFEDSSIETGLAAPSAPFTGFGTAWIDFDNDGWQDLVVLNGAVTRVQRLVREADPYPLHQTNQLFRNQGGGRFREVTAEAGEVFALSEVSRGAAVGDLDNDGAADLLVTNNNGPARLLRNEVGRQAGWLGLRLLAGSPGRDALGARARIGTVGGQRWRLAHTDGSYASASDPRLLVGLGGDAGAELLLAWPDGARSLWRDLPARRYLTLLRQPG